MFLILTEMFLINDFLFIQSIFRVLKGWPRGLLFAYNCCLCFLFIVMNTKGLECKYSLALLRITQEVIFCSSILCFPKSGWTGLNSH